MPASSWFHPGTVISSTRTGGSVAWTAPSRAVSSNDSWASATLARPDETHWLWCTNFAWTVSDVPATATIVGLEVQWERHRSIATTALGGTVVTSYYNPIVANALVGTQKTTNTIPATTDSSESQGGAADLWGTSFTAAQAIHVDTGIAIAFGNDLYTTVDIFADDVQARWHYTLPSSRRHGSSMAFKRIEEFFDNIWYPRLLPNLRG